MTKRRHSSVSPLPMGRCGFTLVEIIIVVLIIGLLLAIAIPNFISARESSRARACVATLSQINSAKMQSAMDNKLAATSTATFKIDGTTPTTLVTGPFQLVGTTGYIRNVPVCPSGGAYTPGVVSSTPTCDIATGSSATADYQAGGRWYHGY